jgi:hypothetical protein
LGCPPDFEISLEGTATAKDRAAAVDTKMVRPVGRDSTGGMVNEGLKNHEKFVFILTVPIVADGAVGSRKQFTQSM